jgi:hypothetical protein
MAYGVYGSGGQLNDGNPNTPIVITQGPVQTATATATLTPTQVSSRILVGNPSTTAATYTLPTFTLMETAFNSPQLNFAFDLYIVNLGTSSGVITVAAGTGVAIVGSATIAITSSGGFRFVKTSATGYTAYRIT